MLPVPPLILMPEVISTKNTRRMLFIEKAKKPTIEKETPTTAITLKL